MQVARTAATSDATSRATSSTYAPLYLTSTLGNTSFDIEELQRISLTRLQVLKSGHHARTLPHASAAARHEAVRKALRSGERREGLQVPPSGNEDHEDRLLRDEASHFLLRLALCADPDTRHWLLTNETALFASRLDGSGAPFALRAIQKADGPVIDLATWQELERFRAQLDAVAKGPNRIRDSSQLSSSSAVAATRYYKLKFHHVSALVRQRKVFLNRGMAFVSEHHILDVVVAHFRQRLSDALDTATKAAPTANADKRLRPILESIRHHFSADGQNRHKMDGVESADRISLSQLHDSVPMMPLCMSNMMGRLQEHHHLRHAARMQLGVFLKGCGLTMDESLKFWKTQFGRGDINADKFDKNYAYNIRHHYGKEGRRKNVQPYSCMKVINERPGPNEHNGCPFREFGDLRLKSALRAMGIDNGAGAVDAVVERAKQGNFQAACGMCFAATQPGPHDMGDGGLPGYVPNHPNEYFIEARRRRLTPAVAPQQEAQALVDEEIDEDEMLYAAQAAECERTASGDNTEEQEKEQEKEGDAMEVVDAATTTTKKP